LTLSVEEDLSAGVSRFMLREIVVFPAKGHHAAFRPSPYFSCCSLHYPCSSRSVIKPECTCPSTPTRYATNLVAARDAIGLLLSLLLGFTLAVAIARFDQRKQLLVDEANSISSAVLRARMLPEPVNTKVFGIASRIC
jgi:hypothetical protein